MMKALFQNKNGRMFAEQESAKVGKLRIEADQAGLSKLTAYAKSIGVVFEASISDAPPAEQRGCSDCGKSVDVTKQATPQGAAQLERDLLT